MARKLGYTCDSLDSDACEFRGYTPIHAESLPEQPNTRRYTVIHGAPFAVI